MHMPGAEAGGREQKKTVVPEADLVLLKGRIVSFDTELKENNLEDILLIIFVSLRWHKLNYVCK